MTRALTTAAACANTSAAPPAVRWGISLRIARLISHVRVLTGSPP